MAHWLSTPGAYLRDIRLSAATLIGAAIVVTASPLHASGFVRTTITVEHAGEVQTTEYVQEYEPGAEAQVFETTHRFVFEAQPAVVYDSGPGIAQPSPALASYGPFNVVSPTVVEMVGDTDSYSPRDFRRLLAAYPGIREIHFVECGGTFDDYANLQLARMIRRAGIATHVPAGGSTRSGGVELFLAGARRTADPGAEFIVHSWLDNYGREASDLPMSDPAHQAYLSYYREIGMAAADARDFYALTNSVPHDSQRRLTLGELASFGLLN